MALTPEQIAEIATQAAISAVAAATKAPDAVTAKVLKDAPRGATQSRRTATVEKAAAVTRDTTAIVIGPGGAVPFAANAPVPEDARFVVYAASPRDGSLFTNGARFAVFSEGRPLHRGTLPSAVLTALAEQGSAASLLKALGCVDERALLGSHRPVNAG